MRLTERQLKRIDRVKATFFGAKITNLEAIRYLEGVLPNRSVAVVIFHYNILGWR
jgi:hypothetical protein